MRIVKVAIGWYLVLCLVLAGAVGLSPLLHVWLEHGGVGAAHVHWSGVAAHSEPPYPHPDYRKLLVNHGDAFDLPDLRTLGRLLALFVPGNEHDHSKQRSQHEHQSLAQLMLSGLVEQPLPDSHFEIYLGSCVAERLSFHTFCAANPFDLQSAGRAPPFILS